MRQLTQTRSLITEIISLTQYGSYATLIENTFEAFNEPNHTLVILKTRIPYQRAVAKNPEHHIFEPKYIHKFHNILISYISMMWSQENSSTEASPRLHHSLSSHPAEFLA